MRNPPRLTWRFTTLKSASHSRTWITQGINHSQNFALNHLKCYYSRKTSNFILKAHGLIYKLSHSKNFIAKTNYTSPTNKLFNHNQIKLKLISKITHFSCLTQMAFTIVTLLGLIQCIEAPAAVSTRLWLSINSDLLNLAHRRRVKSKLLKLTPPSTNLPTYPLG